jgi:hypothetical protein
MVYVKNMAQLNKDDLVQMNEDYFKSLEKERLVEVAKNLHQLATDLWEKQQQSSDNSSQPPSKDNPYTSKSTKESEKNSESETRSVKTEGDRIEESEENPVRCVAHLIRKAVAITGVINSKAAQIGQWILDDLRELIALIAEKSEDNRLIRKRIAGLRRVCHLGKKADHTKLQALAKEILNDWDAVVAFVNNPELPPTNNEAERALRHAVIARKIGFGTRTYEGSLAYSSLLSIIETCRLRKFNPWIYLAEVLALARKGLAPPTVPVSS